LNIKDRIDNHNKLVTDVARLDVELHKKMMVDNQKIRDRELIKYKMKGK